MQQLNLKPTHKLVKSYYEALGQLGQLDIDHEGAVRGAFQNLLAGCGRQFDWTLVAEWAIQRPKAGLIKVDGALIDAFHLPRGFWEAKDEHDDLDKEIRTKLEPGYPRSNIIFQAGNAMLNSCHMTRRDPEIVTRSMRAVRSRATTVERLVSRELHRLGYTVELNVTDLPGKPDIVFAKKKLAVFVDGDYWHGRQWKLRQFASLERQFLSINNRRYWVAKISSNVRRDRRVDRQLRSLGWHVVRIWESDWKKNAARCIGRIERFLQ